MLSSSITVITPAESYDLTTINSVKAELGISDNSEDEHLYRWIRQASGVIADYCNRVFAEETLEETFRSATNADTLVLARCPIVSIASIVENGVALAEADYEIASASGTLIRLCDDTRTCWPTGKIVVTFTAGYALLGDLPYGVERAAITLVSQYRHDAGRNPNIRSESTDGLGSTSWFDGAGSRGGLPPEVVGLLQSFQTPAFG